MPKVDPNLLLLDAIEEVVTLAGGNESEAARRIGTTRLRVNRIRKAQGGATPAVRNEMWTKLKSLNHGESRSTISDTSGTKTIQSHDVRRIALHVLHYITSVLERDIGTEGQSNAH